MEETRNEDIAELCRRQKEYFAAHSTRDYNFRVRQLKKLRDVIIKYDPAIKDALRKDLHKSPEEVYLTEISIVLQELNYHIRHLKKWMRTEKVKTPVHLWPSKSRIVSEPLGSSLIIAPWNYPFQLLINPLVGALSAGCTAVLKPSPYVPNISGLMEKMIAEAFPPELVTLVQGGRDVNSALLEQPFDIIFFTGSPDLGRLVMHAAADKLIPVVLELGGKSPCIVDRDADITIAARRIAWGKTVNAGQTCIAPDYLFVHKDVKDELIAGIRDNINSMYGKDTRSSDHFPRIVNEKAFTRLEKLMDHGSIFSGGERDREARYIAPTIIDGVKPEYPIMGEEIFGPLLPVMTFSKLREVEDYVNSREKPLALYFFGDEKKGRQLMERVPFGGGCINEILLHIANHHMPFGGVGGSGQGRYHGKESFTAFSHRKSVVIGTTLLDLPFRYAPFRQFKLIRKIL
ncbi:MAG: aldehyde dehydrogenase [Spirochaetales bacterium]|nr:aldehyde dehydrogenase [Spirochaetales bacterium]